MRLVLAAPGRLSHPGARAWSRDYSDRIARSLPIERIAGRESARRPGGSDAGAREREGRDLAARLPAEARIVGLDVGGRALESEAFAAWLIRHAEGGTRCLCFVIGGPDGLGAALRGRCHELLALSALTMPHELAEVVLLEQIYRAITRWKGLPYSR
jgi:23S rRNA (pseudouridine1915-N3)-methyltransferase